jgi:hypothetical protein
MTIGITRKANAPTIIFVQTFLHEFGIKGSGCCYKCVIDGWPLITVVGCHSILAIKFSGKRWIDGKWGCKKL